MKAVVSTPIEPEDLNHVIRLHRAAFDAIVATLNTLAVPVTLSITTLAERDGWQCHIMPAKD